MDMMEIADSATAGRQLSGGSSAGALARPLVMQPKVRCSTSRWDR